MEHNYNVLSEVYVFSRKQFCCSWTVLFGITAQPSLVVCSILGEESCLYFNLT